MRPTRVRRRRLSSRDRVALNVIAYLVLSVIAFVSLFPFLVLLINSFASEHYIINNHYRADPYLNNGLALAAHTKNAAKTMQVLDRIMEDTSYNFLVYFGIEGKNYVVKDGKIDLPEGLTADKNTYPPDAAGFWFTNKDQFPAMATWTPAYLQHRKDIVAKGFLVTTPWVAFSANVDDVKTEVANVNQTLVQYLQPLWIGLVPDVDQAFGTLSTKLKAAGVDKLRTVFQAQVDDYLKRF